MTLYKPKYHFNEQRSQPNLRTSNGSAFGIGLCVAGKYNSDMSWVKSVGYIGLKFPSL